MNDQIAGQSSAVASLTLTLAEGGLALDVLGGVPERLTGAVSKTVVGLTVHRGFESLPLR
jgi:hypothetical protein